MSPSARRRTSGDTLPGDGSLDRLTLRYTFSIGTKTSAQGLSILSVPVRNMQLDVEIVSGGGRVSTFVQTIDNGSGDSAIRVQ